MADPALADTAPRLNVRKVAGSFLESILWVTNVAGDSWPFVKFMRGQDCIPTSTITFTADGKSITKKDILDDMIRNVVSIVGDNIAAKFSVRKGGTGLKIEFSCAQRLSQDEKLTKENYQLLRDFITAINPDGKKQLHLDNKHLESNALGWILECLRMDMEHNAIRVQMTPTKNDLIDKAKASATTNKFTWTVAEKSVQNSVQNCLRMFARNAYVETNEDLNKVLREESEDDGDEHHKKATDAMENLSQILLTTDRCAVWDSWFEEHMPYVDLEKLEYFLQRMRSNFVPAVGHWTRGEVEVHNLLDKIRLLIRKIVEEMELENAQKVIEWIFLTLCNDNDLTLSDVEEDFDEMESDSEYKEHESADDGSVGSQPETRRFTRSKSQMDVPGLGTEGGGFRSPFLDPIRDEMVETEGAVTAVVTATRPWELQNMSQEEIGKLKEQINKFIKKADSNGARMGNAAKLPVCHEMFDRLLDSTVAYAVSFVVQQNIDKEFPDVQKDGTPPDEAAKKKKNDRVISRRLLRLLVLHGKNDVSLEIAKVMEYLIQSSDNNITSEFLYEMTSFAGLGLTQQMEQHYNRKDFTKVTPQRVRLFLEGESERIVSCFPTKDDLVKIWENVRLFYTAELIRMLVQFMITVKQNEVVIRVVNDLMKYELEIMVTPSAITETGFRRRKIHRDKIPETVEKWLYNLPDTIVAHKEFTKILFAPDQKTAQQFSKQINLISLMKRIWWQLIGKGNPTRILQKVFENEKCMYLKTYAFPGDNMSYYNKLLEEYGLEGYSPEQADQEIAGWKLLLEAFIKSWKVRADFNLTDLMSLVNQYTRVVDLSFKSKFDSFWLHNAHEEDGDEMVTDSGDESASVTDEESEADDGDYVWTEETAWTEKTAAVFIQDFWRRRVAQRVV